ncbi:MAG: c-type cytochrome, partial [Candidatus Rokubacteria bacterium]|nr:c-type cytochrome [Candidatus Rokubacteria bacterium]
LLAGAGGLAAIGLGLALPPLTLDATPTTYHRPLTPYHATSIIQGVARYRERCAGCHGHDGAGADGPDLRSARVARLTAGDLYWWISRGARSRRMPGFGDQLGEDARWDVVNFVRALGAAEAARDLGPTVEPNRPWLTAPDFSFTVGPMPPRALRDYRGRRLVLLALYSLPASLPRLEQLARNYDVLVILGVEVLAVPRAGGADAIRRLGGVPRVLFPVVTAGAEDIVRTYDLFGRAPHAEYLIDRQGYLRARWAAAGDTHRDLNLLLAEVQQLNEEKTAGPPADEHVH